jgi:hypothetical protein
MARTASTWRGFPFDRVEQSAQDVDLVTFELGAREQTTQLGQQPFAAAADRESRCSPSPAPDARWKRSMSWWLAAGGEAKGYSTGHYRRTGCRRPPAAVRRHSSCTAEARLSEVYSGLAGMKIVTPATLHLGVRQSRRSRCRTTAPPRPSPAFSREPQRCGLDVPAAPVARGCGVAPTRAYANIQSRPAPHRGSLHTCACARMSPAPAARATASSSGKRLGLTRVRRDRPIVFIARAAAPMLPGWLGCDNTMRTLSSSEPEE